MIEFSCSKCGKLLTAESHQAGRRARCSCGNSLLIPNSDGSDTWMGLAVVKEKKAQNAAAENARLPGVRAQVLTPPGDCPVCGQALVLDAVVCTTCGYDSRTRQRLSIDTESTPRKRRWLGFLPKKQK
jgi:DNA-directed RNA polymerase subunit M/transcription elongation factor TFIIS